MMGVTDSKRSKGKSNGLSFKGLEAVKRNLGRFEK